MTASDSPSDAKFHRILIVRLGSMGDVIHTLPAAVMLREAFPRARIGWLIEERWAELLGTVSSPRSGARSAQRPLVEMVPTVALPPATPFTCQVTAVLVAFCTVAVNCGCR